MDVKQGIWKDSKRGFTVLAVAIAGVLALTSIAWACTTTAATLSAVPANPIDPLSQGENVDFALAGLAGGSWNFYFVENLTRPVLDPVDEDGDGLTSSNCGPVAMGPCVLENEITDPNNPSDPSDNPLGSCDPDVYPNNDCDDSGTSFGKGIIYIHGCGSPIYFDGCRLDDDPQGHSCMNERGAVFDTATFAASANTGTGTITLPAPIAGAKPKAVWLCAAKPGDGISTNPVPLVIFDP